MILLPQIANFPNLRWMAVLAAATILASCATSGDVKKVAQANELQDRRIQALERTTPIAIQQAIDGLRPVLDELNSSLQALRGRSRNQREEGERAAREQAQLAGTLERMQAELKALLRTVEEEQKRYSIRGLEVEKALDGVRTQLASLDKVLKSRLAKLPSATKADRAYRTAYSEMTSGELDTAAAGFAQFVESYPKDRRKVDALYRQSQAQFLMRKYDSALVASLELVEKYPKHRLANDAKWILARSLEETGDLKLAREFYTQLIAENTPHKTDATRRVFFIDRLYPRAKKQDRGKS